MENWERKVDEGYTSASPRQKLFAELSETF
jgi:hypothetical protein